MRKKVIYKEDAAVEELIEALEKQKGVHFTPEQCSALHYGLSLGAEVEHCADPVYDGGQLRELFEAQAAGLDTRLMKNPAYSFGQMHEIAIGLKDGVNASVYANPSYTREHMSWMRRAMSRGIDIKNYPDFFKSAYAATRQYKALCNGLPEIGQHRYRIKARRVVETEYEIVVECSDFENLQEALEAVNAMTLESAQSVKNKLYEQKVQIRESRFSDPVCKSSRIELFWKRKQKREAFVPTGLIALTSEKQQGYFCPAVLFCDFFNILFSLDIQIAFISFYAGASVMNDLADGLDHGFGIICLEDVTAHINAVGAAADSLISHFKGFSFRDFLTAGNDKRNGARGCDFLEIIAVVDLDDLSTEFCQHAGCQGEILGGTLHFLTNGDNAESRNAVAVACVNGFYDVIDAFTFAL